jgi:hypothetical protein
MRITRVSTEGFEAEARTATRAPVLVAPFFFVLGLVPLLPLAAATLANIVTALGLFVLAAGCLALALPRRTRFVVDWDAGTVAVGGSVRRLSPPFRWRLGGVGHLRGVTLSYQLDLVDAEGEVIPVTRAAEPACVVAALERLQPARPLPVETDWGLPRRWTGLTSPVPPEAHPAPAHPAEIRELRLPRAPRRRLVLLGMSLAVAFVIIELSVLTFRHSPAAAPSLGFSASLAVVAIVAMLTALFGVYSSHVRVALNDSSRVERWSFGRCRSQSSVERERIRGAFYVSPDAHSDPEHVLLFTDSTPQSIPCGTPEARRVTREWLFGSRSQSA